MISCVIIDDEEVAREGMKILIDQIEFLELKGSFANALEADIFLKKNPIDLLFLDIHMPKLNGLEYLKMKQHHTRVILTTAYTDHAIEAFEYGAIDYAFKKSIYWNTIYRLKQNERNAVSSTRSN